MHESTISRVTSNKYVHTPRGIFELKFFFNSAIKRGNQEDIASESVKQAIKKIVDEEDPKRPYSDQAIVELLAQPMLPPQYPAWPTRTSISSSTCRARPRGASRARRSVERVCPPARTRPASRDWGR